MQNFMEELVRYVEGDSERKKSATGKSIIKLWDHINLALTQEIFVKNHQADIVSTAGRLENQLASVASQVTEAQKKVDGVITQMVSIVSIFTAISFVVFGGISSFQSIFTNVETVSLSKLMVLGCVWAFLLINLLFVFIYFIAKLTKVSIKTNPNFRANLIQRYPIMIYINMMLLSILAGSLWIKFVEVTVGTEYIISLVNNKLMVLIIGSVMLLFVLILIWRGILKKTNAEIKYPPFNGCGVDPHKKPRS